DDVFLQHDSVLRRADLDLGPALVDFDIGFDDSLVNFFGFRANDFDLLFGQSPGAQRALDPVDFDDVAFAGALRLSNSRTGDLSLIESLQAGQQGFVQFQLGYRIDQVAFFLADVLAPDDSQQLSLGDSIAQTQRTRLLRTGGLDVADQNHLAGKPR